MLMNTISIPIIILTLKVIPIINLSMLNTLEYWSIVVSFLIILISILLWKYGEMKANNYISNKDQLTMDQLIQ